MLAGRHVGKGPLSLLLFALLQYISYWSTVGILFVFGLSFVLGLALTLTHANEHRAFSLGPPECPVASFGDWLESIHTPVLLSAPLDLTSATHIKWAENTTESYLFWCTH